MKHDVSYVTFNIDVYTYPYRTIGNILPKLKDSVDAIYKRGAIYKIPCKDCSGVYIGGTTGALTLVCLSINVMPNLLIWLN